MEHVQAQSGLARLGGTAVAVARGALSLVVGVLTVDRDLYQFEYEDLYQVNW
jgi:hypothetical protein